MPDNWDPTVYRQRAGAWRQRAMLLEDDDQQDAYLLIAEGHERLAGLIEVEVHQRLLGLPDDSGTPARSKAVTSPRPGPEA